MKFYQPIQDITQVIKEPFFKKNVAPTLLSGGVFIFNKFEDSSEYFVVMVRQHDEISQIPPSRPSNWFLTEEDIPINNDHHEED